MQGMVETVSAQPIRNGRYYLGLTHTRNGKDSLGVTYAESQRSSQLDP